MSRNPDKIDYSQGVPAGFRSFERTKDPRVGGNTLHHLGEIIFVAFTCILCVKGNQGNLHKDIRDHFEFAACQLGREKLDPANWSHAETLAKFHGRNERQTIACHDLE